ncbi:MAG: hypothetical protein ACLFPO_05945 [Spirochaetaceae bacterium]
MKRLLPAVLLMASCLLGTVRAHAEVFGVGVLLGEPTGVSAKARLGPTAAVDAAAAWSFVDEGSFYFHADYLMHFNDVFTVDPGELPLYVGVGGMVSLRDDPLLGLRIPVGLAYEFETVPLDVFFEVAPGMGIFPETSLEFGGGLGIRYYFETSSAAE